ncbi:hypothetical protein [Allomuricauda sp. NBRC 101325]|uniref:hypothetical protein n=1 Tax=Allomuricauda sp. NBRC 101325 TaxID=1113758 RepID=UPI0024A287DF|nr:hypothetical protein [Muricauda sp. NBRC 101325]GLU44921.1 hypothetical protein Musp01_25450 [Muricauda sp. NBRC 101325]
MKNLIGLLFFIFGITSLSAQEIDGDLLKIKSRMDAINEFSAELQLDLDAAFINMPTKYASMHYTKGKDTKFSSDDFVVLPKRGLDFAFSELFEHPFITVDRGIETKNNKEVKVLNVIPTDNQSDMALATLYLDVKNERISASEITTKKNGTYALEMEYPDLDAILPSQVQVSFAIEKLKIPLNFMGSDTDIDRKTMRQMDTKTGKITLLISNYKIN